MRSPKFVCRARKKPDFLKPSFDAQPKGQSIKVTGIPQEIDIKAETELQAAQDTTKETELREEDIPKAEAATGEERADKEGKVKVKGGDVGKGTKHWRPTGDIVPELSLAENIAYCAQRAGR